MNRHNIQHQAWMRKVVEARLRRASTRRAQVGFVLAVVAYSAITLALTIAFILRCS